MSDPRNVAHDKKVMEEKKHHSEDPAEGAAETPQPGKKPAQIHHASDDAEGASGEGASGEGASGEGGEG